jgi:hypothetical protein
LTAFLVFLFPLTRAFEMGESLLLYSLVYLALPQIVIDRETGVFENPDGKATTQVTTGVNRNGDGHLPGFMPKGEVATRLSVFLKSLGLEEANEVLGRDLGHPAHQGTATVSSST